jgi:exonuclease VII small subunit
MSKDDFEKYLKEITEYTEKIKNNEIPPEKSIESLVKAGIYNRKKILKKKYKSA